MDPYKIASRLPHLNSKVFSKTIKRNHPIIITPSSHPDEVRKFLMEPNHQVIQGPISYVQYKFMSTKFGCESNETDHPITELDSHSNMAVLEMNALVFESTGRIFQ